MLSCEVEVLIFSRINFAKMIGEIYAGFGPTLAGSLIGAVWGFGIGFVFFYLAASIYNRLID